MTNARRQYMHCFNIILITKLDAVVPDNTKSVGFEIVKQV